jgi:hypothetical protein
MTVNKYANITVSLIVLVIVVILGFKYCGKKTYTQTEIDAMNAAAKITKQKYVDSLDFVRGQLDSQQEKTIAQTDRVENLEKRIDSLVLKHAITKNKIKLANRDINSDTGFVITPNEYVHECEGCFDLLGKYKKENIQLRFERDSYDSLMRQQNSINENRIAEVEDERNALARVQTPRCDTTRKLKLSLMGMASNPFLPKGGGFGFIYEDKRFNEYGAHAVFTGGGTIYIFNIAKTISFRRKK